MIPATNSAYPLPAMREASPKWRQWEDLLDDGARFKTALMIKQDGVTASDRRKIFKRARKTESSSCVTTFSYETDFSSGAALKVATTSASSVFARLPRVRAKDEKTQFTIDALQDEHFWIAMQEAETLSSAYGGAWLTTQWNAAYHDAVIPRVVSPQYAEPTFSSGVLTSVVFVHKLSPLDQLDRNHWRLAESHELLSDGVGIVRYRLFYGPDDNFGSAQPLSAHPESSHLEFLMDDELFSPEELKYGRYTGLVDMLDVVYVKNPKPQTHWTGPARYLGLSDLYGAEDSIRELDQWLALRAEEGRMNKTRLQLPAGNALAGTPGSGVYADVDRSVYTLLPVSNVLSVDANSSQPFIQATGGKFNNEELAIPIEECWERIARLTGFSLNTLGLKSGNNEMTATGVRAKQTSTEKTVSVKQNVWRPALVRLLKIMLAQQDVVFGTKSKTDGITVTFPPVVIEDPANSAQVVASLLGMGAMSLRTAISTIHPDWDEDQIEQELSDISRERETVQKIINEGAVSNDQ